VEKTQKMKKKREVKTMYECKECREVITNPVCPGCLNRAMVQWLGEINPGEIRGLKSLHRMLIPAQEGVDCILCKKSMDYCAHCYSKFVLDWIRSNENIKQKAEEFSEYFNFDLDYLDYGEIGQ
jgi:hypothetical protein